MALWPSSLKSATTVPLPCTWTLLAPYRQGGHKSICLRLKITKIVTIKRHLKALLMLEAKRPRPLDIKSIAHLVKSFVIKGNTMTLKMRMSTFLTEKR